MTGWLDLLADARFTGPVTDDAADLVVATDGGRVAGELTAPSLSLSVRSEWLVLSTMTAYQQRRDRPAPPLVSR